MKRAVFPTTLISIGAMALVATPALADRAPNPDERAAVEKVLRANGFLSWEEIELDDDGPRWEIDDARDRDNARWDIKIDPKTMKIVKRERDD